VSKLSHVHFVSNEPAAKRLLQMGETDSSMFVIGSPDVDIMFSGNLPDLPTVKSYYEIPFESYAVAMFHPVTTESHHMEQYANQFVDALLDDGHRFVIIFPNNDLGSKHILSAYERLKNHPRFRIFPSLRFEYFLTLLKNAQFIIGNSSAGIREAPYYGIPVINIGTRQSNRALHSHIINTGYDTREISSALRDVDLEQKIQPAEGFGSGNSAELFLQSLQNGDIWKLNHQKQFRSLDF
jgi:UDP-N-acetylglucosamine 2-epimerase (hydrolysing)